MLPSACRCWLAGAALAALAAPLLAQSLPAGQAQGIKALYDAAHAHDATYLGARAQAESDGFRAAQAEALLRPSAALVGAATHAVVNLPTPYGTQKVNLAQLGVQARQPLYHRADRVAVEQARRGLDATRDALDLAEQDLIVRVAQAYFDVLAAQDALATTRAGKAAIAVQLASAKRNFDVGNATITDTREAQARFDISTAQEIAAENTLRARRIVLDLLVGMRDVQPRPVAVPLAAPPLPWANVDDWVAQALAAHPQVRRAQVALDVARLETERARATNWPTVDAVGSYSRDHQSGQTLDGLPGTTRTAAVGLQLNMPLFAGYAIENRVKETVALEERSLQDLEAARRGVSQATQQAFFLVESGQAQVKALEAAEASSQLALDATRRGYTVGVRINLDVLDAQTQLDTTRRDLSKSRYDLLVNGLRLRQAAGQLQAQDLAAIDALLVR